MKLFNYHVFDLEKIFIDDKSNDGTETLIRNYANNYFRVLLIKGQIGLVYQVP